MNWNPHPSKWQVGEQVKAPASKPSAEQVVAGGPSQSSKRSHRKPSPQLARAQVVVNGTSVGLPGHEARLPQLKLRAGQLALDFVYGETDLVRAARAAGARLVSGEAILVRQGALAFTWWTGRPAPEAVMAAALGLREDAR